MKRFFQCIMRFGRKLDKNILIFLNETIALSHREFNGGFYRNFIQFRCFLCIFVHTSILGAGSNIRWDREENIIQT